MEENSKLDKIIEARMKLKARFEQQMAETPSVSDTRPMGSGAPNRHGMPQLPVGQTKTVKWPVLDLGFKPDVPLSKWKLVVDGEVESPLMLTWDDFMALPQTNDVSDFHCVTTWSRMDVPWVGVRLVDIAALVMPKPTATHVLCHGYDQYTTNLSLQEALKEDVLLVHTADGKPLERDHGGPVRMITPQLYAWKGSKWISRIQFLPKNQLGFWELRGYSNTAYPWRNDRYS
ncbi:DMSO/TMAO reductase YedYZ molybdopterin-dependent catalytic subunit [Dyadobacter sp. BE34]|uniref:DMSO/TMAO reductase YedYZ molybdopterin-dependent catalytic subunit n=1 Tax=Dyadobacter fermentans TaxID=94254 RepID=A0ABU1R6Z7_9BACT|nr:MULTISPECIES: molybdopterin-dependent oxidoreductase [Dyadobacter]MDR6809176.1 DMSO/TMAO reductase YedYZ molybdopterin-dependent catalytic subunit [Dyadobacter fermentans]MDR7046919.1 DMSO/TMAO reductase YedYZ molybdopterin-dependent catalytic subunit [Dyadobacter sp. BE242]MDR7201233.1 DMSO/TMAO reductase YedYZ molybdopterin-dependent catalytic subunit [Dyadobacter sp. BE34]MDR7219193.1 DMSO/TMAO reductase YedYZ molybdopterin-dependent catalytic subunit [Dyadobacter sp. BE31]MDR7264597.1 D